MPAPQARTELRAAERQPKNSAPSATQKKSKPQAVTATPKPAASETSIPRAETNRANAQHSTGPRTAEGKTNASKNSFKHGLYASKLIMPDEDPAELDEIRASFRAGHQPVGITEEILVNELAEHFWRIRRARDLEARSWQPEVLEAWYTNGLNALIQRSMACAERSFHKTLNTLRMLQRDRGFVPAIHSSALQSANTNSAQTNTAASSAASHEPSQTSQPAVSGKPLETTATPEPPKAQPAVAAHKHSASGFVPSNLQGITDLLLSEDDDGLALACSPSAA